MMLWLSLNFYQLPLDVFTEQSLGTDAKKIFAVVDNGLLVFCNQNAINQGLFPKMKVSTAYALSNELEVKQRDYLLEEDRLTQLATIAYEFSSQVCIYNPQTVLLEVEASCKLFIDLASLLNKLSSSLSEQSVCCYTALASTPKASYLLSIYEKNTIEDIALISSEQAILDISQQTIKRLEVIPISFLEYDRECQLLVKLEKIKKMGIHSLEGLFKLPMSAMGKRFGQSFLKYLYCLKGDLNDPQVLFELPETFSIQRCFVGGLDNVEQILFLTRGMLETLVSFINLRRKMATKISWSFICFNGEELLHEINLSSSNQTCEQLMILTRLKLQSVILKDKIEMVFLKSESFLELEEKQENLNLEIYQDDFDMNQNKELNLVNSSQDKISTLMDKINVRLGNDKYHSLKITDHHLPEKRSFRVKGKQHLNRSSCRDIERNSTTKQQPLWLLEESEIVQSSLSIDTLKLNYKGEIFILSKAEIIESDWWNNYRRRKYYIAKNNKGVRYWIYFDLNAEQWFLHGVF